MKKQKNTVNQLFGLDLAPLYLAIAQVESQCGKTSDNIYQIRDIYIRDVNRIVAGRGATGHFSTGAKFMRDASESMMRIYWDHWGKHYQEKTGMPFSGSSLFFPFRLESFPTSARKYNSRGTECQR